MNTEEFFSGSNPDQQADPFRDELVNMIRGRYIATPRHQQRELGPSDISHPCMRKMALGIMEAPEVNPQFDPLPSIIGTAMHTWLESAADHANMIAGRTRWLTETRLTVAPGLSGSCDLFDLDTETVIDWKVIGSTRFAKYRKDPGPIYRTQVHLYARGFENMGQSVKQVAIAIIPRGATLGSMHVWRADYDPAVADEALKRRDRVLCMLNDLDIENHPERFAWIEKSPHDCIWCPWWRPKPQGHMECEGEE